MSNTGSKQMKDMSKEKKLEFRKLKKEIKEKYSIYALILE
jgi:hypothetical protein